LLGISALGGAPALLATPIVYQPRLQQRNISHRITVGTGLGLGRGHVQ